MSIYTNANWAKDFDVVVHDECFGSVTNNALIETITAAHQAGLPAVMLHCSTHSYRAAKTDEWRKLLGVSSYSHEKLGDLQVTNLAPNHPIMKGFPAVWSDPGDELYKSEKLWPNTVPLAQAWGVETKTNHIVIWVNTYGKARVFATTLGHSNETVGKDVYLDLVTRGLLWACGRLEGAEKR
jgi:type 1 glutamine amidotransferase